MPYQYYPQYPQQIYPQYPQYQYPQYQMQTQPQPVQQPVIQQPTQVAQPTQQIQNGGFVSVHDEEEARNYPVAPGNSVTFKDESAPYVYTKTQGFSQLDRPQFVKYRLVRESDEEFSENTVEEKSSDKYALKSDVDAIASQMKEIRSDVDALYVKKPVRKKEEGDD